MVRALDDIASKMEGSMPVAIYSEDTGRLLVTFDGIPGLDHVIYDLA